MARSSDGTGDENRFKTASGRVTLDAVIVGGGFGGCYLLQKLRKQGLTVKLVEALDGFGGVWRANWYPGARVDCEMPYYLFSDPDVMRDWTWTERFPGAPELRRYFDHVDRVWDLSKDTFFNTRVSECRYEGAKQSWKVDTANENVRFTCRWLLLAVGTSHKQHIPKWTGISTFKGPVYHPAGWPRSEDPSEEMQDKRVAVIGAGSSALQVMQEAMKCASHVTQFIRTPITAMPMQQRPVGAEGVNLERASLSKLTKLVRSTPQALPFQRDSRKAKETSVEEREAHWASSWDGGGLRLTSSGFSDQVTDKDSNRLAYNYWARRTRERISDPIKRDILAPIEPTYYFNTKRPGVEQDYYTNISQSHIDVTNSPITSFDATGIHTADGQHRPFDLVVAATGYDAVTGGLLSMRILGRSSSGSGSGSGSGSDMSPDPKSLNEAWSDGVRTYLGLTAHGFPNMFFTYGPQAPTSFTGGTPFIEQQVEWVCGVIEKAGEKGWREIEATREAEQRWRDLVLDLAGKTLMPLTDSWWNGANVPGKKRELLLFAGGQLVYFDKCREAAETMEGFRVA